MRTGVARKHPGWRIAVLASALPGICFSFEGTGTKAHADADHSEVIELAPGLAATLFASEAILEGSITNIDVDERGRVWACEVRNYRAYGEANARPDGDRILILEDTTGDGKADVVKTFYQGRDVDAALGISVLGNQVIITCAPNVIVFTDENGDDVPDRKEYLFTESGRPQSDHSTHSVLPGPDGRLYWNTGDYGDQVKDRNGKLIYDRLGKAVVDRRQIARHPEVDPANAPYVGGMVFRFDPDGSSFEVLAHNFRNNYEVAIDSFGSLWQSDNDDDGFHAVRLNFVMEYGNYGYRDELTGGHWRTPRVSEHSETHRRHWHQNDPGVVPDFAYTGAGSPTGLTVYEGRLLPEVFWDEVIACDAGPGVVWAVKAHQDGAGFSGEVVPLMQSRGSRGWFRPVDVAVAPDGSLFVSDWHDPAVGGNRQLDPERGRIYRLAPPDTPYRIPKIDYDTASNAAAALLNPSAAVQYKARLALAAMGEESLEPLIKVFSSLNMRHRARALWLLSKMESGPEWIDQAISDADADIRITALRAARARRLPMESLLKRVVSDKSPAVRREAAIALRELDPEEVPALWVELARQHVSNDRWYLEALGIGASHAWDGCMRAWQEHGGDIITQPGRDIVWRSRATVTPALLAECLELDGIGMEEVRRLLRAFDFQPDHEGKRQALKKLLRNAGEAVYQDDRSRLVAAEVLLRLHPERWGEDEDVQHALEGFIDREGNEREAIALIGAFNVKSRFDWLIERAAEAGADAPGPEAIGAYLRGLGEDSLRRAIDEQPPARRRELLLAVGASGDNRLVPILLPELANADLQVSTRVQFLRALAATRAGSLEVIELARTGRFPEQLRETAAALFAQSMYHPVRTEASAVFPLPRMKGSGDLPAMTDLLVRIGDPIRGRKVFQNATCAQCHQVHGTGISLGPDLSHIGSKLAKRGIYQKILTPSASISESYRLVTVVARDGREAMGFLIGENTDEIDLQTIEGPVVKFPKDAVLRLTESDESLMPAGLHQLMTADDLVNLVEYLATLK